MLGNTMDKIAFCCYDRHKHYIEGYNNNLLYMDRDKKKLKR